jgi:lipopolysaccharide export LptBFGC system permease protein LptF
MEEVMIHILIGAAAAAGFSALILFSRTKRHKILWWQWILTLFAFAYSVFVLELVVSFLEEGTARGALVMGLVLGFIALIWAVLLGRFVFKSPRVSGKPSS